jgi:hypothetical protein
MEIFMRRALTVVLSTSAIVATAWLAFFLFGYGVLTDRTTVTRNAESSITCHYLHAKGFWRFSRSAAEPHSFSCPGWVFLSHPHLRNETRREQPWAQSIPLDQFTVLECRFLAPDQEDSEDGLSNRFGSNSPLRLTLAPEVLSSELLDPTDREALGSPTMPLSDVEGIFLRFDAGALPIFGPAQRGRLTILISPRDGRAAMFLLRRSDEHLLWSRRGGCRPSA